MQNITPGVGRVADNPPSHSLADGLEAAQWRTSRRSGMDPRGNCVQVTALVRPIPGDCHGACTYCGGDAAGCTVCNGTGVCGDH